MLRETKHSNIALILCLTYMVPRQTNASPEAVFNTLKDLWGDVVRCSTKGGGGVSRTDAFLTHAIVSEFDVTLVVQQHIVQLEVPVNDA